ncbi:hypothetical protein EXS65_00320 [Candidatus Peribacteria bacterium]|nr:hypothetical protein [Candidatus Peribacteria bacterium]
MDIEHFKHRHFKPSLIVSVILSILVVILASALGRSTLNLKGAVSLNEPKEITVIALVELKLKEDVHISDIRFLRKEDAPDGQKAVYAYHVQTNDENDYLVKLKFDPSPRTWTLSEFVKLYGSDTPSSAREED